MHATGRRSIERQTEVSAILTKRLAGQSLREIGESMGISAQAVHAKVKRALDGMVTESMQQVRQFEVLRLDELLGAIYPKALEGDIAAIDRVLQIMQRRARLLGLDLQPGRSDAEADPRVVHIEIVNNPEVERMKWLEGQVELSRPHDDEQKLN